MKGKWVIDYEENVIVDGVKAKIYAYKCSVCDVPTHDYSYNFCPYCGADMRGEYK